RLARAGQMTNTTKRRTEAFRESPSMPTEVRDLQAKWTVLADNDPHETAWSGEDVVIGRNRRGVTLMHLYQDAPEELGILRPWLANRLVVYKYYKNLANNAALYLGMETLYEVSHSALT